MKQKMRDLPGNKWITNGAKKHYPLIYHQKQLQSQLVESNLPLPYYICGAQCSKRKKSSKYTYTHFVLTSFSHRKVHQSKKIQISSRYADKEKKLLVDQSSGTRKNSNQSDKELQL